jgi:hypothetical protein
LKHNDEAAYIYGNSVAQMPEAEKPKPTETEVKVLEYIKPLTNSQIEAGLKNRTLARELSVPQQWDTKEYEDAYNKASSFSANMDWTSTRDKGILDMIFSMVVHISNKTLIK